MGTILIAYFTSDHQRAYVNHAGGHSLHAYCILQTHICRVSASQIW